MTLLHDLPDFGDLIVATARAQDPPLDPSLVEKDYWIMHALWGLQVQGFAFELKGGHLALQGLGLIHRFSEDIDIRIAPPEGLLIGKNHTKPAHIAAREAFFDDLAETIVIPGFVSVERDRAFDNARFTSAGIRLNYPPIHALPAGVKTGVLLEAGFDQAAPNQASDITSWAYERALASGLADLTDNRALGVACYEPGYTLVEKLQTVSTKFRQQKEIGEMPANFLRHYYDIYCLLGDASVQAFIGTPAYLEHKAKRFPRADEKDLTVNPAFQLSDPATHERFASAYKATSALYYRGQPPFEALLTRIQGEAARL